MSLHKIFSDLCFPVFKLNMEMYRHISVDLCYGIIWTRKNSAFRQVYVVRIKYTKNSIFSYSVYPLYSQNMGNAPP